MITTLTAGGYLKYNEKRMVKHKITRKVYRV